MADISEHNSKQERESYYIKNSWINFFIARRAVSNYDFMERPDKFIDLEICGWIQSMFVHFF